MTKSGRMVDVGEGRTFRVKHTHFQFRPITGLEIVVAHESMNLPGKATGVRLVLHDGHGANSLLKPPHVVLDLTVREATQLAEYLLTVARDAATPRPQLIGGAS